MNSINPDSQSKFRKRVGLIKVNLMNTQKEEVNIERGPIIYQAPYLPYVI